MRAGCLQLPSILDVEGGKTLRRKPWTWGGGALVDLGALLGAHLKRPRVSARDDARYPKGGKPMYPQSKQLDTRLREVLEELFLMRWLKKERRRQLQA